MRCGASIAYGLGVSSLELSLSQSRLLGRQSLPDDTESDSLSLPSLNSAGSSSTDWDS